MYKMLFFWACGFVISNLAVAQATHNYAPNLLHIPELSEKGDVSLGLGESGGRAHSAIELRGAFSPLKRLAVAANFMYARDSKIRNGSKNGTNYVFWETGIGLYDQFPKGIASLFVGYGTGRVFSNFSTTTPGMNSELHLNRWYFQPGLMYRDQYFRAAVALRLSRLHFNKADIAFALDQERLAEFQQIEGNSPFLLPEIGVQAGLNLMFFSLTLNLASIFPETEAMNFAKLSTSVVATFNFGTRRKK